MRVLVRPVFLRHQTSRLPWRHLEILHLSIRKEHHRPATADEAVLISLLLQDADGLFIEFGIRVKVVSVKERNIFPLRFCQQVQPIARCARNEVPLLLGCPLFFCPGNQAHLIRMLLFPRRDDLQRPIRRPIISDKHLERILRLLREDRFQCRSDILLRIVRRNADAQHDHLCIPSLF